MLSLKEGFEFLKELPLARWKVVNSLNELDKFEFPCFLKSDVIGHKTELGAVLKCNNLEEAKHNFKKLKQKFPNDLIILQEASEGIEMIIGLKQDKVFGKLLVVGFGGIFAEVKKDVSFRALPVSKSDVVSMIRELKGFEVFSARGKKYDLDKFYKLVEKGADIGIKKDIKELDLNPVMLSDKDVRVVDVRLELG